jgi:hypothetical protein
MQESILFLDTNTFLHYPTLDHIDWPGIIGAKNVVLLVAPIVIRELNRHKDFPTSAKTRDRASAALRRLHDWWEDNRPILIRSSVELRFRTQDPLIDFPSHNLSRDIADDYLIATILEHGTEYPDCKLSLVTADLGLKLKAQTRGLGVVQLPQELRLVDEPLASEKRIKDLEIEVRQLQNRRPSIKLAFENEQSNLKVTLHRSSVQIPDDSPRSIAKIRLQYPTLDPLNSELGQNSIMARLEILNTLCTPSSEDVTKYNNELQKFYLEYENYLHAFEQSRKLRDSTVRLDILALNEGTCPAEEVDIFIHFPDGFSLHDEQDLPGEPHIPEPPPLPQTPLERATASTGHTWYSSGRERYSDLKIPVPTNVSRPSIRRTKSYDVKISIRTLKHQLRERLRSLYVVFDSIENAHSFSIDYRIHAINLPEPLNGKLHLAIAVLD